MQKGGTLFGAKHGQNNLSKTFDDDDAEEVNTQKSRTHQMIDKSKKPNTFCTHEFSSIMIGFPIKIMK